MADQSELASHLRANGLDDKFWLEKLKNLGVESMAALKYLEGDTESLTELEKEVRYKIERKALRKLLKIDEIKKAKEEEKKKMKEKEKQKQMKKKEKAKEKSEQKKKELHEREEKSQKILEDLQKARSEGKERHDMRVQKLERAMREALNIPTESWISKDRTLDELISQLEQRHQISQQVQERSSLDDSMLLQRVSGGRALQGVLLTSTLEDQLQDRDQLLLVPENVLITGDSQAEDIQCQFSSVYQEDTYKKSVDVLGHSIAVSGSAPIYGAKISVGVSKSDGREEESTGQVHKRETYSSTVKYSTLQVASYSFKRKDLKLSDDAKYDLHQIQSLINTHGGSTNYNVREACERFFKTYGSHANRGPLKFGGNFWWVCSSRGFQQSETKTVKLMQKDAISTSAGVSFAGFGVSTEVNIDKVKGSYKGKCTDSTIASTHLQVKISGGPPEATDLALWKSGLVANNSTWILTDRGNKLIPVWDIIRRNHNTELGSVVDALRNSWEKMTGFEAEHDLSVRLSYDKEAVLDEVSEWNEKEELTPRQIEDNLKYLLKVKNDIVDKTGARSIWVNEYMSDVHLQEFLVSVVASATPQYGHVKFIMQSLIELEELKKFDTRTFPEIDQLCSWLYGSEQLDTPSSLTINVLDFESFDSFLDKTLENERIIQLNSGQLFSSNSAEPKHEVSRVVSKAIYSLRSQYQQTYDDVLIIILVYPFQSGNYDNIITLHPISLDDLETIRKQFSQHRAEFCEYLTKQRPLHLQAYLFKLAVDLCSEHSQFQQLIDYMASMMRSLQPPLEQDLQVCLDQRGSSLSNFQENLKHLMTKPLFSQPSIPVKKNGSSCSLKSILRTGVHQRIAPHADMLSVLRKNPVVHDLLEKLGLTAFYPKKLLLRDALCIRPKPLELSLNNTPPTDLKQLPYLVLHKLMVYDVQCRSNLMLPSSIQENGSKEKENDDYYDDYGDYDTELGSKSTSDGIHPVDAILSLFICSDDILRQDLLSRMAKCQLSVPFILPDPFTKQLTIPLWALRSIIKDWKSTKAGGEIEPQTHPIVNYPMPIISFIGFTKQKQGKSKSILLNDVISGSHSHFFHRDCSGGHYDCLLGQGLVDMCWYLPAGQASDFFSDAVTFLNLHGDARQHPQQSKFLGQISSMCFVLLTEEVEASDTETIKILKMFSSCPGGITLLDDVGKKPEKIMKEISGVQGIRLNKNAADIKRSILGQIRKKIKSITKFQSIEACCSQEKIIFTDEDSEIYKESLFLASEVKSLVMGNNVGTKDAMLPLQGQNLWQSWAENDRELYRQSHRGAKRVNDYTAEITRMKEAVRREQLEKIESLTPVMKSFLASLLTLRGSSNTTARNYFLQCLKLELNNISRQSISKLQQQYQDTKRELAKLQDKTMSQKTDVKPKIEACQKRLSQLQDSIINTSVGLEHFFRELGQVYEAAIESTSYKEEDISCLPQAAAELLIDGYPLEVVDGDAAHVPLKWFTAVFKEAVKILKNPKVFVMSVLGLQSTGKSTMLNTAFGLQFNVSAGRCTRGAFIQLLPLDEELKQTTKCSYVLVVDTEGLRAPELDPLKTQKHDNELATFVIGLANMTLINIYGEVPGDMDDILQTSVHAFLRMTQVRFRPSCQFVHQNAGSNVKSEVGRSKFAEKLNKFTVDAAREEHCEGQYETFNDVIKFDSETDVHHFQGLWKGDPPMAPVNEGYSHCAQKLKQSSIDVLQKLVRSPTGDLDLSSFNDRVGKLWHNLLKENFVFSFKNTLEITAYNSLEMEYSKWDWEFREGMLEWEQTLENEIKATTDSNAVSSLVQRKRESMRREVIPGFYQPLKAKMDAFFKGKQADILIQWKKKFDTRLTNLSSELQEHAEKHCKKLRQSTEGIAKIKSDQTEYAKKITVKVKEHIATLKQEQEKLNQNLKKKQLESVQMKKLLEKELFSLMKIDLYKRKKIITQNEANAISEIVSSSGSPLTESEINRIIFGGVLTLEQVKTILKMGQETKKQLKATFDLIWIELVDQIPFVTGEKIEVEVEVESMLLAYLYDCQGQLVELIRKKHLAEMSSLYLKVEEKKHYNKVKGFNYYAGKMKRIIGGEIVESPQYHIEALEITEKVFDVVRDYLNEMETEKKDSDFNTAFTQELLRAIDKKITEESIAIKDRLTFTREYRLDMYLTACGYAIPKFKKMSESFRERHDPRLYLDKHVKGPLYTLFENQYYQAEAEEAIANTLCSHLEEPIKTQVGEKIGKQMVSLMKSSDTLFSTKMSLKVKILSDLQEEDKFEKYMEYILRVKESILKWIKYYTIKFCDEKVDGGTRLQLASKEEVKQLIGVVENKLNDLHQPSVQMWVKVFCNDSDLKTKLGINLQAEELLAGYETLELSLDNFKDYIRSGLTLLKDEIQSSFNNIYCESEMSSWRDKPHDLLKSLIGCTEQCPFCGEQCDLQDSNHYPNGPTHSVAVHRSTCLAGFRDTETDVMTTGFCPAFVTGKEYYTQFRDSRTNGKFHPYKDYQSKYPEWTITPDVTSANSLYWKKFVGRYMSQIAQKFNAKSASVPGDWSTTSKEKVRENLKTLYHY